MSRRQKVKAKDIAQDLEISVRQVYRDIDCLKLANIPIYSDRQGFALMPDFFMPKISLEVPEMLTLFVLCSSIKTQKGTPYCDLLGSACDKILNALPEGLRKMFLQQEIDVVVDFGLDAKVDYKKTDEVFHALYGASMAKKQVKLNYYSMDSKKLRERTVDPYAFKLFFGIWYLIGYCHLRKEIRTFRIDRIRQLEIIEDSSFKIPDDFDIDGFFADSWGIIKGAEGREINVKIRFSAQIADFIQEATWHPSQKLTLNSDGTLNAEFKVDGTDEIKVWILGFGQNAEVLEPLKLRKEISGIISSMKNTYN